MELPNDLYALLYSFRGAGASGGLALGGSFSLFYMQAGTAGTANQDFVPAQRISASPGASVQGAVDLYQNGLESNDPLPVEVAPDCKRQGAIRPDYRLGGLDPRAESTRRQMKKLFEWPIHDEASWEDVTDQFPPGEFSCVNGELPRFRGTIVFTSHPDRAYPPGSKVVPVRTGKGLLRRSIDTWLDSRGGLAQAIVPMADVQIDDCSLLVEGNCRLRPIATNIGSSSKPKLVGSKATLLVRGTLCLDEAQLEAGSNGMVIFSKHFFIKADGNYNGLIVGQEGGAFFGAATSTPTPEARLNIRGGVLIGNNQLQMNTLVPFNDSFGGGYLPFPTIDLNTLVLSSTRIEYAPEYLRGLNQFGGFHLTAMMRR